MSKSNTPATTKSENEIPVAIQNGMRLEWTKGENAGKPFSIAQQPLKFDLHYDGAGYGGDLTLAFLEWCAKNGEIKVLSTPKEDSPSSLQVQYQRLREALEEIARLGRTFVLHDSYDAMEPHTRLREMQKMASDALADVQKEKDLT